ncbi:hypothetical protein SK128_022835 [Halocaridina rubra]|uniref:Uncharacterized protein n=1 Tax=Halocaridina rubra TaxID=373956 RepID=A0AAN8XJ55_HALRR
MAQLITIGCVWLALFITSSETLPTSEANTRTSDSQSLSPNAIIPEEISPRGGNDNENGDKVGFTSNSNNKEYSDNESVNHRGDSWGNNTKHGETEDNDSEDNSDEDDDDNEENSEDDNDDSEDNIDEFDGDSEDNSHEIDGDSEENSDDDDESTENDSEEDNSDESDYIYDYTYDYSDYYDDYYYDYIDYDYDYNNSQSNYSYDDYDHTYYYDYGHNYFHHYDYEYDYSGDYSDYYEYSDNTYDYYEYTEDYYDYKEGNETLNSTVYEMASNVSLALEASDHQIQLGDDGKIYMFLSNNSSKIINIDDIINDNGAILQSDSTGITNNENDTENEAMSKDTKIMVKLNETTPASFQNENITDVDFANNSHSLILLSTGDESNTKNNDKEKKQGITAIHRENEKDNDSKFHEDDFIPKIPNDTHVYVGWTSMVISDGDLAKFSVTTLAGHDHGNDDEYYEAEHGQTDGNYEYDSQYYVDYSTYEETESDSDIYTSPYDESEQEENTEDSYESANENINPDETTVGDYSDETETNVSDYFDTTDTYSDTTDTDVSEYSDINEDLQETNSEENLSYLKDIYGQYEYENDNESKIDYEDSNKNGNPSETESEGTQDNANTAESKYLNNEENGAGSGKGKEKWDGINNDISTAVEYGLTKLVKDKISQNLGNIHTIKDDCNKDLTNITGPVTSTNESVTTAPNDYALVFSNDSQTSYTVNDSDNSSNDTLYYEVEESYEISDGAESSPVIVHINDTTVLDYMSEDELKGFLEEFRDNIETRAEVFDNTSEYDNMTLAYKSLTALYDNITKHTNFSWTWQDNTHNETKLKNTGIAALTKNQPSIKEITTIISKIDETASSKLNSTLHGDDTMNMINTEKLTGNDTESFSSDKGGMENNTKFSTLHKRELPLQHQQMLIDYESIYSNLMKSAEITQMEKHHLSELERIRRAVEAIGGLNTVQNMYKNSKVHHIVKRQLAGMEACGAFSKRRRRREVTININAADGLADRESLAEESYKYNYQREFFPHIQAAKLFHIPSKDSEKLLERHKRGINNVGKRLENGNPGFRQLYNQYKNMCSFIAMVAFEK